jgi:hypothetical protein
VGEPHTIHHSELGPSPAGSPISREWDFYRREAARLLAEGHEGQWVLIKGEEVLGFFDTRRQASDEGHKRFLLQGFLVHQIKTREPVSRVSCYPGRLPSGGERKHGPGQPWP